VIFSDVEPRLLVGFFLHLFDGEPLATGRVEASLGLLGFCRVGFTLDVARDGANADQLPTLNTGNEFQPAREKLGLK